MLFGVITRCRDPAIRRAALAVLVSAPTTETVWNSRLCAQICRKIIELEEDGQLINTAYDIPEEKRIHNVILGLSAKQRSAIVKYNSREGLCIWVEEVEW